MKDIDIETSKEKAMVFFERGEQVASTDNFDYAIDLYLEGIKRDPDALENGHAALRRIALLRQSKGGKKPSMVDKLKHKGGKGALGELINAEYLLAKDPDNIHYAEAMLNACMEGGYMRTADWISRLVFSACKAMEKPPISILENLKNHFVRMEMYGPAVNCCSMVLKQRPDDHFWVTEQKNLSASATIQNGKYDKAEKFMESVQDKEGQERVRRKDSIMRDDDYRRAALEEAERRYHRASDVFAHRIEYAKALSDINDQELVNKACGLLMEWYELTEDFGYKRLYGDIMIKQLRDNVRKLRTDMETRGKSPEIKEKLQEAVRELADFETDYFTECVKYYPSEPKYKYELGLRLMHRKDFDKAIPLFQQSSKKPGLKIKSLNLLGMSFFNKGWYSDAIDVFESAIKLHPVEDDVFKELRYNLARACELDGRKERALTIYRKLAQLDYSYRDVASRVNKLRDL
ncbi:MAG: tetratricopeptide repeat protein [Sedimentisphaeraceae bacterium JB056]